MSLKEEVLTALQTGADYEALLALVRRHFAQGVAGEQAYDVLQGIWLDFGFDAKNEGGVQDELEYVMERVWYWGEGA